MPSPLLPPLRHAALLLAFLTPISLHAQTTYNWGFNASGNWSDSTATTGWNAGGAYPNASGDTANIALDISSSSKTVTIDVSSAKAGILVMDDTGSSSDLNWTLATTDPLNNKLTLETLSGNARISGSPNNGTNVISAPLVLNSNTDMVFGGRFSITGVISGIGAINKSGGSSLFLSTVNSYTGGTTATAGQIFVTGTGQSLGTGSVTISGNTELRLSNIANINVAGGAKLAMLRDSNARSTLALAFDASQAEINSFLTSNSTGILSLVTGATTTQALNLAGLGDGNLFLGAGGTTSSGNLTSTYGAATLGVGNGNTYRLGGGLANVGTLVLASNVLAENSGTSLIVGQTGANSGGTVQLNAASAISGTTTINNGTLTLFGASASVANSDVTANLGTAISINSSTSGVTGTTRAKSLTMNGATLTLTGNNGANTVDTITNALTLGAGSNTITVTGQATRSDQLVAGSLARSAGGSTFLFRGLNLGSNTPGTINTTNITFGTAPTGQLVGGGGSAGSTNIGILPYAIGGITAASGGTSFVTYDANGIRPLNTTTEYISTFAAGANLTDNVNVGATAVTAINSATRINSLLLSGAGGVDGTGTLTVTSGAVFASANAGVTGGTLSVGTAEGILGAAGGTTLTVSSTITGSNGLTTGTGTGTVALSGVVATTGGAGFVINGNTTLSGAAANTYTGTTTLNAGTLTLSKTAGVTAITGDLVINGGILSTGVADQIDNNATVTLNAGTWNPAAETIGSLNLNAGSMFFMPGNLTMTNATSMAGGAMTFNVTAGTRTVTFGALSMSGGTITGSASSGNGGTTLNTTSFTVTNKAYGAYTPITFFAQGTGANLRSTTLTLNGDFTFNRDAANLNDNTVSFTESGTASSNSVALGTGADHTFTIANGQADIDVLIQPRVTGASKNLIKAGAGTLKLDGVNTYNGTTTVNAGRLIIGTAGTLNSTSSIAINGASAVLNYEGNGALTRNVSVDNGGTFYYNNANAYSGTLNLINGSLGGSGPISGSVTLNSRNDVLRPGNSPGVQSFGSGQAWSSFTYEWETNNFSGNTAGTDFDQIQINGSLTLTAGTGDYGLDILSLTGGNIPGDVPNFSETSDSWIILTTTGGILNFDAGLWSLDTSGFGPAFTGTFSVTTAGNNLVLNYTAIPEPGSGVMLMLGAAALLWRKRRGAGVKK